MGRAFKNVQLRHWTLVGVGLLTIVGGIIWWYGPSLFTKNPIETYKPEDRKAIMKLLKDDWYWMVSEGATDFSPDYMLDHHAATLHYADNTLSIAVYRTKEGKIAGFVTFHPIEGYKGRIQFLAVAKEFRKKGYAKALLQYAINGLKKQGMCFIEIAVRSNNIAAATLYKKIGFKETWSTPDGFLLMNKSLCGSTQDVVPPAAIDW
jgi:ribosomal protein S18 acetylase RimI-like enzyme